MTKTASNQKVNTFVSDEELIRIYSPMITRIIFKWSQRPANFVDHIDDIRQAILIKLLSLPKNGSRRSKWYCITTIQTAMKDEMDRIIRPNNYECLSYDSDDVADQEIFADTTNQEFQAADFRILVEKMYNSFTTDEKLVFCALIDSNYKLKQYIRQDISRMIFKSKADTQIIIDSVLKKAKLLLEYRSIR